MASRKTDLNDDTARAIAHALNVRLFERYSHDAKHSAQRNLSGKTHYADDDTLNFFHARINSCRTECNGLVLVITESAAADYQNKTRGHRFVAFDLFGTVLNDRDHADAMRSKSGRAYDDSREWLESFDVLAHYKAALAEHAARLKRDADAMAKAARSIRVPVVGNDV